MEISVDAINAKIALREAEVLRLRHDLEIAEAKLRGMIELREQLLGPQPKVGVTEIPEVKKLSEPLFEAISERGFLPKNHTESTRRAGRQEGAISTRWRRILGDLHKLGKNFDENIIISMAKNHDINLKPSDARFRMMSYRRHGFIAGQDGSWKVADAAIKKFSLNKLEKNEAPNEISSEPKDILP